MISFVNSQFYSDSIFSNSDQIVFKKGSGASFDGASYNAHGSKGNRGYLSEHESEKGVKGYHDREGLKKNFGVEGGNKNSYNHNDGYYGVQNSGFKGSKGYNYADRGSYAKGHSTKGRHNVHKLDEFKKKTDFFDEDHDQKFKENHGGYEVKKVFGNGDFNKGGYLKSLYLLDNFGRYGEKEQGKEFSEKSGYTKDQGLNEFIKNVLKFDQLQGQDDYKKYGFLIKQ